LGPGRPTGEILETWQVYWRKAQRFLRTWGLILIFYFGLVDLLGGTVRGLEPDIVWPLIGAGLILGGWLAWSSLRGWIYLVLNSFIGFFISAIRVGSLEGELFDAVVRFVRLIPTTYAWAFRDAERPAVEPFLLRLNEIWMGLAAVWGRLVEWGENILNSQPYFDPVVNTFLWSIAVWGIVIWSMWGLIRTKKPFIGFLPGITLVIITMSLVGKTPYNIVFMVGAMLAMMVFVHHDNRESQWLVNNLNFNAKIRRNILVAGVSLTLGLMAISLITPSISIERIAEIIRERMGQTAAEAGGVVNSLGLEGEPGEVDILDASRAGGLPNSHLIGSGVELTDQVVMTVNVESHQIEVIHAPIYLRGLTYDKYTGRGWESRGTQISEFEPGEAVISSRAENTYVIRQHVRFVGDLRGFVYSIGMPISIDQDFRVAWRVLDGETNDYDILASTVEEDEYRVDSYQYLHSVDELKSAGQSYPAWIRERYMSLPPTVPESVLALAVELTATEVTPYDRAVAIEQYLREIPYSLDVSTGPAGADIVEYFLFNLQEGYCDYYATAMVVLARAAGLPARYVTGYIGEDYDPGEDVYMITADQAHAWVEVYFPTYGWAVFEPTGGRAALERPPEPFIELPQEYEIDFTPLVPQNEFSFEFRSGYLWLTFFVLIIFGFVSVKLIDWRISRWPEDQLLSRLYPMIYRYARWAGLEIDPGNTPYHFSSSLRNYMERFSKESHWERWMMESLPSLDVLTEMLVQCLFNPVRETAKSDEIVQMYRMLRPRLWLLVAFSKAYPYRFLRPFFWVNPPILISVSREEEL
jgi:transglutaminase-like putative cysteine protease